MSTSAVVPYKEKVKNVRDLLEKNKAQIALALPRHMTIDRVLRIVLTEVQKIPLLMECEPKSLIGAVHEAARLGLEFGATMGQAYMIPFKNNKRGGIYECQFLPGYRGLISLARRGGEVSSIKADIICRKDVFDPDADNLKGYRHIPYEFTEKGIEEGAKADPGPVIGAYAAARFKDGGYHVELMSLRELNAIRARSRAKDSGPWVTDEAEMQKKTVARRLCKWLPMSVELARAVTLSDAVDEGLSQGLDVTGMGDNDPIDVSATEVPSDVAAKQWLPASVELARAIELAGLDALSDRMEGGDGEQAAAQEVSAEPVLTSPPSGAGKKK